MAADNSKNTNIDSTVDSVKQLEQVLKKIIKTEGDFNNILSDTSSNLKALTKELEKQSIYIDEVANGERKRDKILEKIQKEIQKEKIAKKELNRLTAALSEEEIKNATDFKQNIDKRRQLELEYIALKKAGKDDDADMKKIEQMYLDDQIEAQERSLNVTELEYAATLKLVEARGNVVEELKKQEGTLGRLERKMSGINKFREKVGEYAKGFSSFEGFTNLLEKIPAFGGLISGLVTGLKAALDFILEIEDRAVKFGRNLGYSRDQSFDIAKQFGNISTASGNLLITTQNLMEVQTDLSEQLGVNNILTGEMLSTQVELKKVMGLSTDTMGELATASLVSGKNQKDVVKGIIGQVALLKSATGVSFNYKQIIAEAAKLGGVLGLQFAKYPEKLAKSVAITKALGMDLKKVDQIAGGLLDFESTIQNQLEAQLLTGKDINLSKAQQYALEGKTTELALELSSQMQKVGDFTKLNRIQQDAIAKSVGMTRDEVGEMLKNQEMLSKLGATDTKDAQKKLEILQKQGKSQEELVALLGEEAYANLTGLSAQEKIAALIDKVKGAFQDFLTNSGVVEWITGLIHKLSDPENVRGLINMIKQGVAFVADIIQSAALGIVKLASVFTDIDPALIEKLEGTSAGDSIRSLGDNGNYPVKDFVIKPMNEDTITMAGGTKLGRTDEMVDLLKQLLNETRQGKVMSVNIDGAPVATAVARNAPMNYAASNLGPRPLR
jgi:hypothetical protein